LRIATVTTITTTPAVVTLATIITPAVATSVTTTTPAITTPATTTLTVGTLAAKETQEFKAKKNLSFSTLN
jgi:hypothetical protein